MRDELRALLRGRNGLYDAAVWQAPAPRGRLELVVSSATARARACSGELAEQLRQLGLRWQQHLGVKTDFVFAESTSTPSGGQMWLAPQRPAVAEAC